MREEGETRRSRVERRNEPCVTSTPFFKIKETFQTHHRRVEDLPGVFHLRVLSVLSGE